MRQFRIDVILLTIYDNPVRIARLFNLLGEVPVETNDEKQTSIKYYYDDPIKCLRAVQRLNAVNDIKIYVSELRDAAFTNFDPDDDIEPINLV